ncbi:ubiquitin-conjugating enzyme E2 variant protein [Dioscorea alata]|uniref:Ubiquitin-conjugating enzyme E2 variant protein n=1 Tax=Dioscorea alata TaxID=55571 RepID=A0ACB7TYD4_DIOAL|nr:ubiquitin-conjugating enzyme E2 variant protein [Dioscorea alata]
MSSIITPRCHLLKPHHVLPSTIPKLSTSDQSLHSTWSHRFWLTTGCATFLTPIAKSLTISLTSSDLLPPLCASFLAFSLADLATGFYHWSIDNYGSSSTPLLGSQIQAFQGHHKHPSTITHRHFANNLHALGRAITFTVLPLHLAAGDNPTALAFIGVCSGCIMFSQQFHAWAHEKKSRLPPVVLALQEAGVLVSRSKHAKHHRSPYSNNYCIVSGMWNEVLDGMKVFEVLEMVLFFKLGVRPRSWVDPSIDWMEVEDDDDMVVVVD